MKKNDKRSEGSIIPFCINVFQIKKKYYYVGEEANHILSMPHLNKLDEIEDKLCQFKPSFHDKIWNKKNMCQCVKTL